MNESTGDQGIVPSSSSSVLGEGDLGDNVGEGNNENGWKVGHGDDNVVRHDDELHNFAHRRAISEEELHEKQMSALMFLLMIVVLQVAVFQVKARYPKRFQEVTLVLLWLYPLIVLYKDQHMISLVFTSVWLAWSARTLQLTKLAMTKPLAANVPEKVYGWFLQTHKVCYLVSMTSIYTFLFLPGPSFIMLFFSLYIGVLGRDICEISAGRISSTIGYTKYETPPPNLCALCGEELRPMLKIMSGEVTQEEIEKNIFTLQCEHKFHKQCIMGWCIVGKKDTCPHCREVVDLKSIIPDSPWNSKRISVLYLQLLGVLRFLVVWNPIIFNLDLFLLKIMHFVPIESPKDA